MAHLLPHDYSELERFMDRHALFHGPLKGCTEVLALFQTQSIQECKDDGTDSFSGHRLLHKRRSEIVGHHFIPSSHIPALLPCLEPGGGEHCVCA